MSRTPKKVLGGRESVKVAIVQKGPVFMDRAGSIDRARDLIKEAADAGAELVAFPEVWLCGYPYWTEGWDTPMEKWAAGRAIFREAAILAPSEDTKAIGEAARDAGVYVSIGCNEIDERPESETIYNTLLLFGRDGALIGKKRKLVPTFIERVFWGQGDENDLQVWETDIGRIGALICGENLMPLARSALMAQGEDIHLAVFPGAFRIHTGPMLEELDEDGSAFWGHVSVRQHAMEGCCFVVSACGYIEDADIGADFPYRENMNTNYAKGGSSVIAPLGVPLVPPTIGSQILYADLQAWMIKTWSAIMDTQGHYARNDLLRLQVRKGDRWSAAGSSASAAPGTVRRSVLRQAAEEHGVDPDIAEKIAETAELLR
ncbi:MAG: carbon-nitrogen hydrolase family protein [Pseudomonadota bacterium]